MRLSEIESLLQRHTHTPMRAGTILLAFSIPFSVALDNLLLAFILLGLLINLRAVWQIVTANPVARAAWLLFGMLFIAMFYGETPLRETVGLLGKYIDLAFIPMFMLMFSAEADRRRAQYAFLGGMGVTLLLSWLVGLKVLPVQQWMWSAATVENPAVLRSHITQSNMMALAAFLALLNFRSAETDRARLAWGLFALFGVVNVLFMVQGRTGYMIMLVLLAWFAWSTMARYMQKHGRQWGLSNGIVVVLAVLGLAVTLYFASSRLQERVDQVMDEYHAWQTNVSKDDTSIGLRLDFYYNSLQIVRQNPVFGVGTGGFAAAFTQQTAGTSVLQVTNPHNEYLLIAVQTGVIGLALLVFLFLALWRRAPQLSTPFEQDAARGLVLAYLVNSMFNSALHDHSDGLLFALMTAVFFAGLKREKYRG